MASHWGGRHRSDYVLTLLTQNENKPVIFSRKLSKIYHNKFSWISAMIWLKWKFLKCLVELDWKWHISTEKSILQEKRSSQRNTAPTSYDLRSETHMRISYVFNACKANHQNWNCTITFWYREKRVRHCIFVRFFCHKNALKPLLCSIFNVKIHLDETFPEYLKETVNLAHRSIYGALLNQVV